jgi:hypothetical protein
VRQIDIVDAGLSSEGALFPEGFEISREVQAEVTVHTTPRQGRKNPARNIVVEVLRVKKITEAHNHV